MSTEIIEVSCDIETADHTTDGMVFSPMEVTAAHAMLGVSAHAQACDALKGPLEAVI